MERRQAIFAIVNGNITQWDYSNGALRLTSHKGERQIPYDANSFWGQWTDEEYFDQRNDILDAIFLVESSSYLDTFPQWIWNRREQTNFTYNTLEQIASSDIFCNKNICISIAGFPYKFGKKNDKESRLNLIFKTSLSVPIPRIQLLVGKNHLFLRGDNNTSTSTWDISRCLPYQQGHLKETIKRLIKDLLEGYNLSDENDLSFLLYENIDSLITSTARQALAHHCVSSTPVSRILVNLIRFLNTRKELCIKEYGVNFDGVNYVMSNNSQIQERDFSLLGYCLKDEDILS